jgi:hypothetical protein
MWEKICCFLAQIADFAYGDPQYSKGGNKDLTENYTLVFTAPKLSCVILRNISDVYVECSPREVNEPGGLLRPGDVITLYNFRGTLYARMVISADVGGTINFLVMARW